MSSTIVRRFGAALAGGSLLASGLVLGGPAPASHAHETDPTPSAIGALWLEGALTDGVIHNDQFDSDDFGATVEAAYSLDAVGRTNELGAITEALRTNAEAYTAPDDEIYAGSTGKLLSFVQDLAGGDPRTFGGIDLVAQMESVTAPSGRIADVSAYGEFANVFGQSWAVRGLTLAGSTEAGPALDFLLGLQCAPGHFHLDFSDSCSDPAPPVDTTAVVVTLLTDLTIADPARAAARDAAVADAVAWIKTQQGANGSYDGGTATEGPNANSTGLAGRALDLAGEHEAAEAAATWIRARQVVGTKCDDALADEQGAIAYDGAAYRAGAADGITDGTSAQWDFATIQALPALLSAPASEAGEVDFGRVPRFFDGGGTARIGVVGLAPGERACVGIGRFEKRVVGDADGRVVARLSVPDRTGFVGLTLAAANSAIGTEWVVLAAQKVAFERDARVPAGGRQSVVVRDLFSGERVVVRYDGERVARGTASTRGVFRAEFPVGRDRGTHRIKVTGQFADRTGTRSFEVR